MQGVARLLMPQSLPSVVMFAPDEPINNNDEDHNPIDGGDVVHICRSRNITLNLLKRMEGREALTARQHRYHRWERIHDEGKQRPHE